MKIPMNGGPVVPDGWHSVEYLGYIVEEKGGRQVLRHRFKVLDGREAGLVLSTITDVKLTATNKLGKLLSALRGNNLPASGEEVELLDYVGVWLGVTTAEKQYEETAATVITAFFSSISQKKKKQGREPEVD